VKVTYQSINFSLDAIAVSYIGYNVYGTELKRYDVNQKNYTIRESVLDEEDIKRLPADKVAQAFQSKDRWPHQICLDTAKGLEIVRAALNKSL